MLANDIVVTSESAWSSPVIMIRNKDDNYRFCVDYHKLNKVTAKDYPLPRIISILDNLRDAKFLNFLDIRSAYWQIPIAWTSRPYTAFAIVGRGLFQFCRLPFGLTNAPRLFQRLIDNVIGHDLEPFVFVYLDDLIIVTYFPKAYRNTPKDLVGLVWIMYIGYVMGEKGLHVDTEKVSATMNVPSPQNVKQVRRFLGMASWYRRFIPSFANLPTPLTGLLRKSQKFLWSPESENAFIKIK